MSRTTIAIHTETRACLKAGAAQQAESIDGFLRLLLDEHERNQFWGSFADVRPDEYASAVAQDGDDLIEDYEREDRQQEAEQQ